MRLGLLARHDKIKAPTLMALKDIDASCTNAFECIGLFVLMDFIMQPSTMPTRAVVKMRSRCIELTSALLSEYTRNGSYQCYRIQTRVLPALLARGSLEEEFCLLLASLFTTASHMAPLTLKMYNNINSAPHVTERWEALRRQMTALRPPLCEDAATASDGYTYNRLVLEQLLTSSSPLSHVTREPLHPWIAPNYALRG